jgi:selenocysteine lyase/cysteine desulfurase
MLTTRSVIYPWEEIVGLCRKYGIISLVDAAHAIGQVKTNVKHSDPDFWIAVRGLCYHGAGALELR